MESTPPIVLRPAQGGRPFETVRREVTHLPGVSHLWSVLCTVPPGVTYEQEVLSRPTINLTVERVGDSLATWVYGPVTARFARTLTAGERAVAAQFRPGRFPTRVSITTLVDTRLPAADVLGGWADPREPAIRAIGVPDVGRSDVDRMDDLDALLRTRLPPLDEDGALVEAAVALAAGTPDLTRVEDLADRLGTTPRTLQRRFERHLGVGPKWLLRRERVTDLLALIEAGQQLDWASVAVELGFADQAHLTNTFTTLVGVSPAAYERRARAER